MKKNTLVLLASLAGLSHLNATDHFHLDVVSDQYYNRKDGSEKKSAAISLQNTKNTGTSSEEITATNLDVETVQLANGGLKFSGKIENLEESRYVLRHILSKNRKTIEGIKQTLESELTAVNDEALLKEKSLKAETK